MLHSLVSGILCIRYTVFCSVRHPDGTQMVDMIEGLGCKH